MIGPITLLDLTSVGPVQSCFRHCIYTSTERFFATANAGNVPAEATRKDIGAIVTGLKSAHAV